MLTDLAKSRPGSVDMKFASQTEATRINDFIYMSQGSSNSYFLNTGNGDVLINTGLGVEAIVHKANFDRHVTGPLKYILITQGHVDHVGGIDLYKQPETKMIAQESVFKCQEDDARIQGIRASRNMRFYPEMVQPMIEAMAKASKENLPLVQSTAEPDITFKDDYRFTCGDIRFELISIPGGETIDSTLIWLPDHKILFSGNCLGPLFPHMPNLYTIRGDKIRFIPPYLEVIETMMELGPELLITGHFDPIEGADLIKSELTRLRDAVVYLHDETLKGMNAGKEVWDLMEEIKLPDHLEVGEDYGTTPWTVRAIWEGYIGWFKYQSTTELYHVPHWKMYEELADLAGLGALNDRAGALLSEGKSLEAIHLCDIVLAKEEDNRAALETYVTAHEQLLARAHQGNRWEVYWLKAEIEEAKAKL